MARPQRSTSSAMRLRRSNEPAARSGTIGDGRTTQHFSAYSRRAPEWLEDALGVEYFSHIHAVYGNAKCSDKELAQIGHLSRLCSLNVGESSISDAGLVHLKGLTNLSHLGLTGAQVTDVGLAQLNGLSNLSSLDLMYTRLTDVGLEHLKGLSKLSRLNVNSTRVTDAGRQHLGGAQRPATLRQRLRILRLGVKGFASRSVSLSGVPFYGP